MGVMKNTEREAKELAQRMQGISEQRKAEYLGELETEYERLKADLRNRLKDWLIPAQGLKVEYEDIERRLTGSDTKGLSHDDVRLRNAWEDISRGMRYIGGPRTLELGYRAGVAPMPPKEEPIYLQVDYLLRKVHVRAEAIHKYLQWLRDQQGQPDPIPDTLPPTQTNESSTDTGNEPELTATRETVVSILDPLQNAFICPKEFDEAVNYVCEYFDRDPIQGVKPLRVRKGNTRKLGQALGDIHRDIHHKVGISKEYLEFAKQTFDCFANQDISDSKINRTNLYKYMTEKR